MARSTVSRHVKPARLTLLQFAVLLTLLLPPLTDTSFANDDSIGETSELAFSAELDIEYEARDQSTLSSGEARQHSGLTKATVELLGGYSFSALTHAQLGVQFSQASIHGSLGTSGLDNAEWALSQLWIQTSMPSLANSRLRLGRHDVSDPSAWWWDERVDGLTWQVCADKLSCTVGLWTLPRSMVALQDEPDPDSIDLWWLGGSAYWPLREENALTTYALLRIDKSPGYHSGQSIAAEQFDEIDSKLAWIGVQSESHWQLQRLGSVLLQLNGALMTGSQTLYSTEDANVPDSMGETDDAPSEEEDDAPEVEVAGERRSYDISGWAFDTRLQWQPRVHSGWQITLGYAIGSGSRSSARPGSGTFVQSGLHSNDPHYPRYGYLYDPDLANIEVLTLGLDVPVKFPGRLYLQHNRYRRYANADTLMESDFDGELDDSHQSLGHESGLGYCLELESALAMELLAARFSAGEAYGELHGRHVVQWKLQLTYEF